MTRSQRAPEGRADLRISFDLVKFIPFGDGHGNALLSYQIERSASLDVLDDPWVCLARRTT